MKVNFLALVLGCVLGCVGCIPAYGQDAGAWAAQEAAQQAQQQAIQASQQAIQSMQLASQQAQQDMQNAQAAATVSAPVVAVTLPPIFSVKASSVTPGTIVRITSRTHYAAIYYSTNGWTPTTASRRYRGPIRIDATMQLQAIAVAPNLAPSTITSAKYSVPGAPASSQPQALSTDGVLHAGTRLHLVTSSSVNSKTAQVGDSLSLQLNQDVKVGDTIVVPKGTPVEAIITLADHSGPAGTPGDVAFEVHSLNALGKQIPLNGGESLEGANRYKSRGLLLIPVVGLASLAIHGEEAEIKPGMTFTAAVAADTPLQP